MAKQIITIVEKCEDCPRYNSLFGVYICDIERREPDNPCSIPTWCPLPDRRENSE